MCYNGDGLYELLHAVRTISVPRAHVRAATGARLHERLVYVCKLESGCRVLRPTNSVKVLRGFPMIEGWVGVQNSRPTPCFTRSPRRSDLKNSALHTRISGQIEQVAKRSISMEIRMWQWNVTRVCFLARHRSDLRGIICFYCRKFIFFVIFVSDDTVCYRRT